MHNKPHSEETKRKIKEKLKGKKRPLIAIQKGVETRKRNKYKHSEETKKKMRKSHKKWKEEDKLKRRGIGNPNWKGGMGRDKKNGEWRYIEWRRKVFLRDNFTCQICKKVGGGLNSHHIKFWSKYPELRYVIDNGITLCYECHKKIHTGHKL